MRIINLALAGLLALAPVAAQAQTYTRQATPDPGQYVPVFAIACLDAQGRALPPGSASCVAQQTMATSGTVTANQGAPNTAANGWPVYLAPGGAANATGNPIFAQITNFPATQPVSATALPLPAGASTAALQSSTQSAAGAQPSAATGVQGVTGGNPLSVTVTNPTAAAPSTVTANQGTAGAAPWPTVVYVAGAAASTSNPSPVAVQNFPASQAVTNVGTFAVQNSAATPAGTNLIGKVGIDQTTPGTTNGVVVNSGTVTANLGTIGTAATAAGQTANNVTNFGGTAPTTGTLAGCAVATGGITLTNAQGAGLQCDTKGSVKIAEAGSPDAVAGIVPVIANAATSDLIKAAPGNLYGVSVTNLSTTAGYLVTINAAAVPTSGAAVTPVECVPLAASANTSINYSPGPPDGYTTGIVALASTSCTTYTPSTLSAFFHGRAR